MPTYSLVDRFVASVTASFAGAAPLTASDIPLSVVTGLPTGGTAILTILRTVPGRAPTFVDEISDWTGIAGQTLTGAVRRDGAAIVAGDFAVCSWCQRYWSAAAAGGYDILVENIADLNAACSESNAGTSWAVRGGTYTLTQKLLLPSDVSVGWGYGGTGPVTLACGGNDYYLHANGEQGANPGGAQEGQVFNYEYDAANSFGAGAGGANDISLLFGTTIGAMTAWPTWGTIGDWRIYLNGQEFVPSAQASATRLTLTSAPKYKPQVSNVGFLALYKPRRNITMRGQLIVTGTGDYHSLPWAGYNWNTRGLNVRAAMRSAQPDLNQVVALRMVESTMGPVTVEGFEGNRTAGAATGCPLLMIGDSQSSYFDLLHARDMDITDNGTFACAYYGVHMGRTWDCNGVMRVNQLLIRAGTNPALATWNGVYWGYATKGQFHGHIHSTNCTAPGGGAATTGAGMVDFASYLRTA